MHCGRTLARCRVFRVIVFVFIMTSERCPQASAGAGGGRRGRCVLEGLGFFYSLFSFPSLLQRCLCQSGTRVRGGRGGGLGPSFRRRQGPGLRPNSSFCEKTFFQKKLRRSRSARRKKRKENKSKIKNGRAARAPQRWRERGTKVRKTRKKCTRKVQNASFCTEMQQKALECAILCKQFPFKKRFFCKNCTYFFKNIFLRLFCKEISGGILRVHHQDRLLQKLVNISAAIYHLLNNVLYSSKACKVFHSN